MSAHDDARQQVIRDEVVADIATRVKETYPHSVAGEDDGSACFHCAYRMLEDLKVLLSQLTAAQEANASLLSRLERIEVWLREEELIDDSGVETCKARHGSCCTCQDCGFHYDDCRCAMNRHNAAWAALASAPAKGEM